MIDGRNLVERPDKLEGKTFRLKSGCGNMHITINGTDEYPIFEIFTVGGKNGSCSSVFLDVSNILITRCLRLGDDPREIVETLKNYDCPKSSGNGTVSCPEGIANMMKAYLDENFDMEELDEFDRVNDLEYYNHNEDEVEDTYDEIEGKDTNINENNNFEECPECHENTFNPSADGCAICFSCGYSPCG